MTTGNSSPFALCTVISRTPSLPSSTIGASAASDASAAWRSSSMKPRNEMPPPASYWRASSATCRTLASTCSPAGRSMKPTCARVSAEQTADRVRHGPRVAAPVQPLQRAEGVGDRHQRRDRLAGQRELLAGVAAELERHAERMEGAEAVAELEQRLVVDREERSLQRREDRQLVVGPFDRGERRANRLDLFAVVESAAADEQVRQPARLDRVDVAAGQVLAEADEAAEQDRDVPRRRRRRAAPRRRPAARRPSSRSLRPATR